MNKLYLLFAVIVVSAGSACAQTWTYEYPVATGGLAGLYASIKIDASGNPRVAYVGHGKLMYATRTTSWSTEVVNSAGASVGEAPQWVSLAISGTTPHIAYYDARSKTLRRAWKPSGWQNETVDSAVGVGKYASIAVNPSGYPAIAYYDEANDRLKYAYQNASGWHIEVIANGCGRYSSLAFDASGNAHLAYYDSACTLKYAKRTTSWTQVTVDGTKYRGEMCSLAVNASGYPHIAYRDARLGQLRHAWQDAGGWYNELVSSQDRAGFMASIAVGTDGYPRINYFRRAGWTDLSVWYGMETWYAYKTSSGWQTQLIQRINSANDRWCMSMALDSSNRPCVAYYYPKSRSLNYMYYTGSSWVQEIADQGREIGAGTSLAVDSSDNMHIAYYAMDNPNLFYAKKTGSTWSVEQVDSTGESGLYPSLKLLPNGYPAIAYVKYNVYGSGDSISISEDLKYAYRGTSTWATSTVHANAGNFCALALYGGQPRISYGDMVTKGQNLRLAEWTGSSWTISIADAGSPPPPSGEPDSSAAGFWTSIAYDSSGNPHIGYVEYWNDFGGSWSYYDVLLRRVKHAWHSGGVWYEEIVEDGQTGRFVQIGFDGAGRLCMAYQDLATGTLKFAWKSGSSWVKEVVDSEASTGMYASMAFSSIGRPGIAYKHAGSQTLRYAWRDDAGWHIETADSGGRVGDYCSLAYSSNDEPCISYLDADNLTLKVACQLYGKISGYVRDANGQALAGATVSTTTGGYTTLSGADGSYTLRSVYPGTYEVSAWKTGYPQQFRSGVVVMARQTTTVNFSLPIVDPGTISGEVRDSTGAVVAGATITTNVGGYSAVSGATGAYSMSAAPGTYSVTATKAGYNSDTKSGIVVVSGGTSTANFSLTAITVGTLYGIVRNSSGTGLAGVTVSASPGGYTATTSSDGSYTISGISAGLYTITASKTGYQTITQSGVVVRANEATQCNLCLLQINAQLVNGNFEGGFTNGVANGWTAIVMEGSPVFSDETSTVRSGSHAQKWATNGSTHDVGFCQIISVSPGTSYTFSAWTYRREPWCDGSANYESRVGIDPEGGTTLNHPRIRWSRLQISCQSWTQQSVTAVAQSNKITVIVHGHAIYAGSYMSCTVDDASLVTNAPAVGNIAGYVKDSAGNPLQGAFITTDAGWNTAMSAADGSYILQNVPVGTYSVTASRFGFQNQTKAGIVVNPSSTTSCSFNLTPTLGSVAGYVKDASGNAILGATVSVSPGYYSAVSGSGGAYTIVGVPPGNCSVSAYKTGYLLQAKSASVVAGQTTTVNFNLVLGASGTISGYVRNSSGVAIGGAVVSTDTGGYSTTTSSDGSYAMVVAPGTYSVTASKSGYQSSTITGVVVTTGKTTTVDFVLNPVPPGTISGLVKNASGAPIQGATVSTDTGGYTAFTGSDGRYTMSVAPGTYNVTASALGYQSQTKPATVTSGSTVTVDFTLNPAPGVISGFVKTASGSAISGATVTSSSGGYSATTASDGSYSITVVAGVYSLTAAKSGYQSQTQNNITVVGGDTVTCNFFLLPNAPQLVNGNFEGGFTSGVANGWTKFIINGSPEFIEEKTWVRGGTRSQRWWTSYTTHDAGIYQQVAVSVGMTLTFRAWTWRHDAWNNGVDNEATWVGIDPYGGTSATSSNVVWSSIAYSYETWTQQTVVATAQSQTITVFVRGRANWAGDVMLAVVDDATLEGNLPTGSVVGYVKDSAGSPLSGALVSTPSGYTAMSGIDGSYTLQNMLPGTYSITAAKSGYISQTKTGIVVTGGQSTSCTFNLSPNYTQYATIADIKRQRDGSFVSISGVICSRRPSSSLLFVQHSDRSAGIRVTGAIPSMNPGTVCTVSGRLQTVNNVREIADAQVVTGSTSTAPQALAMNARSVGGSDFYYNAGPPVSGQKGSSWSAGANNVGLLVMVWGRVLDQPIGGVFHLSDGTVPGGLPIKLYPGVSAPQVGSFCILRGIAEPDGVYLLSDSDKLLY